MAIDDIDNKHPPKKRLTLSNSQSVRTSLCKLMRMRFSNQIDTVQFRDLVYAFNVLLGYDKHIFDSELGKRIEQLELLVKGEGSTLVSGKELDTPYAQSLKQELEEARSKNLKLQMEVMDLKGKHEQTQD